MHKNTPKKPQKKDEKPVYPMRINKYLAQRKYTTRRQADHLIEKGYVTINGQLAVLGDKVKEGDKVEVDQNVMKKKRDNDIYIAYHKPVGVVTHSPEKGQRGIEELFNFRTRLFPIGRLDQDSHGLIILTNDGRITQKMLGPEYEHEKEYEVVVDKPIEQKDLAEMARGVTLPPLEKDSEDRRSGGGLATKPAKVEKINDMKFRIVLTEGKKRQIRRMCEALGYGVVDLCRTRIMHVTLGNLLSGHWRRIEGEELKELLKKLI